MQNDYFVGNIEELTLKNTFYRKVLFTTDPQQLVLMSLSPGTEIGSEVHSDTTQFFRIEQGTGLAVLGNDEKKFDISDGMSVVVPPGLKHNIINTGKTDLKLYTIYSPKHHPPKTLQQKKPDEKKAEMQEKYKISKNDYVHLKSY
jgi:mannose-6-phosphate isomerase-like protein (cupin superfamily)